MKDLNYFIQLAKDDCDSLDIPYTNVAEVKINYRAQSRWGQCTKICRTAPIYRIEISYKLVQDDVDDMALMNTLIHEYLHTCPGCMNHGKLWKTYAERLNSAYGYNIKRCTSADEKGIDEEVNRQYKFSIRCENCGSTSYYMKESKIVKLVENETHTCQCGRCKGKNLTLTKLR